MMMSMDGSKNGQGGMTLPDDLPPEVKAESEAALRGDTEEQDEAPPVREKLTRKQTIEKEKNELKDKLSALEERYNKVGELEKSLQEQRERAAKLETLLEERSRVRDAEPKPKAEEPADYGDQLRDLRKQAQKALSEDQDYDKYHDILEKITDIKVEQRAKRNPVPEAAPQMAPWERAIEAKYYDVLSHPKGLSAVQAFDKFYASDESYGPQRLEKSFQRARAELGLSGKAQGSQPDARARALHSGVNSNSAVPSRSGGNGQKFVNLPANWESVARRSGVPRDEYVRLYAEANPDAVSDE